MAVRIGDTYEGTVTHFSFWNCDEWFPTIFLDLQFQFAEGGFPQGYKVCIDIASLNTTACGVVDGTGMVSGLVAANELLGVTVYNTCNEIVYQTEIGPLSVDAAWPVIVIPDQQAYAVHITGTVLDCNGNRLKHGFVALTYGYTTSVYSLEADGSYVIDLQGCTEQDIKLVAYDVQVNRQSEPLEYEFQHEIHAPSLRACAAPNENYAKLTTENSSINYYILLKTRYTEDDYTQIWSQDSSGHSFSISFFGKSTGTYPDANGWITAEVSPDNFMYSTELVVEVEKYGDPGELITGVVRGNLLKQGNPALQMPFVCEFSVRRE
jgi:hypothetical protein